MEKATVMTHVLPSETGIVISRVLRLLKKNSPLYFVVPWEGVTSCDATIELIARIYEDVTRLLPRPLVRKTTPNGLCAKAHAALNL